jgi:N4-gp56 family major capsid protein
MAISNFQPTLWSATLLDTLKNSLVFAAPAVANRNYEGEIQRAGTSVKITNISDPTVGTFTKDTDITIQALTDATTTLTINQQKYFAFEVDDLDKAQSAGPILDQAAVQAAYALRNVADGVVAAELKANALAGNQLGAKAVSSSDLAFALLKDFWVALTKQNVPVDGRWAVVTPDMYGKFLIDNRFINAQAAGTTDTLRNGRVGRALGFDIYVSNNCAAGASTGTMNYAGHPMGISYADQILEVQAGRMEKRFADYVKGLHVYGTKVVRPGAIATADVTVS